MLAAREHRGTICLALGGTLEVAAVQASVRDQWVGRAAVCNRDSRGLHGDDVDRAVSHGREFVREHHICGAPIYKVRGVGRRNSVDGDSVDDAVDLRLYRARACGIGRDPERKLAQEVNDDVACSQLSILILSRVTGGSIFTSVMAAKRLAAPTIDPATGLDPGEAALGALPAGEGEDGSESDGGGDPTDFSASSGVLA